MTSSGPTRNWPEWPATLSSPSASVNPVSQRTCSRRAPKYAPTSSAAIRSRRLASRGGRIARSASSQRARVAASGGGAKSAGTGSAAIGLVAVLLELELVLGQGLREVVRAAAVRDRDEVRVARLGVGVERRVEGREARRRDRTRREPPHLVRVVAREAVGQRLVRQGAVLGHRPEHVLRPVG